jgi:hypothetical protein
MTCTNDCPEDAHYHQDGVEGPICDGQEPHPLWCVVTHVTIFSGTIEEAREIGTFGEH